MKSLKFCGSVTPICLKYRIQPGSVGELAFVELDLSAPLSRAACIVEMQNQDGAKMRMYFRGDVGHLNGIGRYLG